MREIHRAQGGISLIEVLASAALVMIVASAVLAAIDKAQKTSGRVAAESVSGNLAQQDQERLRALRTAALTNLDQQRTLTVKGIDYKIRSTGTFVSDATQTPGCTSTSTTNYLKVSSTVSAPAMKNPVVLSSIVNPTVGTFSDTTGGLVVKILGSAGAGTSGITVKISGTNGTFTQPTSAQGCAFFAYVPVGTYTVSYSQAGYVSRDLVRDVSFGGSVSANQITSYQTEYDRAGSIDAQVYTVIDGVAQKDEGYAMTLLHPNLPGGSGQKLIANTPTAKANVLAADLYPFTSAYSYYAGDCAGNTLPASMSGGNLPAGFSSSQLVAPGTGYTPKLFEPALIPRVRVSSQPVAGARVVMTQTTASCSGKVIQTSTAAGDVPFPGLPYGQWTGCAEIKVNGTISSVTQTGLQNDSVNGKRFNLDIPSPANGTPCA